MADFNLEDWDSADLFLNLMAKEVEFNICLKVARNCRTLEEVHWFIVNQECPVCSDTFIMDEVSLHIICDTLGTREASHALKVHHDIIH